MEKLKASQNHVLHMQYVQRNGENRKMPKSKFIVVWNPDSFEPPKFRFDQFGHSLCYIIMSVTHRDSGFWSPDCVYTTDARRLSEILTTSSVFGHSLYYVWLLNLKKKMNKLLSNFQIYNTCTGNPFDNLYLP